MMRWHASANAENKFGKNGKIFRGKFKIVLKLGVNKCVRQSKTRAKREKTTTPVVFFLFERVFYWRSSAIQIKINFLFRVP